MPPDALLGPLGLTAGLIAAVAFLARLLREYIDDIKAKRDEALTGWRTQTEVAAAMARADEARTKDQVKRRRLADAGG